MAIRFKEYVDITSGVGGGNAVRQRDLIGRLFTNNPLVPTGSFVEFTNAEDVGTYFGTTSTEYLRAAFYFGWISKNITKATKISFAHWASAATAPRIYGSVGAQSLSAWNSITAGSIGLTIGGVVNQMSAMNFSAAGSLAAVAAIIQAAIRTKTGSQWTAATVTYDATRQSFNFVGGSTGAAPISVQVGSTGTDISGQLGWLDSDTIVSAGAAVQTITNVLTDSADQSSNFGSFLFIPALTIDQVTEAAIWNDDQNITYQFMVPVLDVDAASYSAALDEYGGVAVTVSEVAGEYPEQVPMMILAATDYTRRSAVQNYMYQEFSLTPSVTTTAKKLAYDALRLNYYGRTQTAGQFIDFYQRGVLMGLSTDPSDQNVFANEQWLKDAAGAQVMQLLLSLSRVSANAQGRSQLIATLQSVIDLALFNGTISVGKPLNNTQKLYIGDLTGDELAWHQVQGIGYWLDCVMQSYVTTGGQTEWKALYTLVYSKDDVIRKVEGSHVLI